MGDIRDPRRSLLEPRASDSELAAAMRLYRKKHNLTQREAAAAARITHGTWFRFERHGHTPYHNMRNVYRVEALLAMDTPPPLPPRKPSPPRPTKPPEIKHWALVYMYLEEARPIDEICAHYQITEPELQAALRAHGLIKTWSRRPGCDHSKPEGVDWTTTPPADGVVVSP